MKYVSSIYISVGWGALASDPHPFLSLVSFLTLAKLWDYCVPGTEIKAIPRGFCCSVKPY